MNPACSTCGHEVASVDKHHGYHQMDMHHRPTFGARPNRYGCLNGWEYVRPKCVSVLIRYTGPDGVYEEVVKTMDEAWPETSLATTGGELAKRGDPK